MSKVRDFIKTRDIPPSMKQKALAEYDLIAAGKTKVKDFNDADHLINAFSWIMAPSGYKLWEEIDRAKPMQLNSAIAHLYTGADCCGILYWSHDGRILCNECGAEFVLKEKG